LAGGSFRHKVFIKTFKVIFRQTAVSERHHPTTGHPWHRLLRLYLLKCHLQLVIDGRRHLLRLRHRLLTLSSAFEICCLDSLIQRKQLLERLRLRRHRIGVTGGDSPKSSVHHGHFPALEK
jgi:hypothetical protein